MAIPFKDSELVGWSTNLFDRLQEDPTIAGVSAAQFSDFNDAYQPYLVAANAVQVAREAGAQTKGLTRTRDDTRDALLLIAREIYRMVQANNAVSNTLKDELGIVVPSSQRTPATQIMVRPSVIILSAIQRTITAQIWDESGITDRRRLPMANGAFVYTFVGDDYPSDPMEWQFMGEATKNPFVMTLGDDVPAGAKVWVCAAWVNTRGAGPSSVPVQTNLPGGGTTALAA